MIEVLHLDAPHMGGGNLTDMEDVIRGSWS
jgi:hypothetical protein